MPFSSSLRVFDRYSPFTDLQALKEASSKPLRKSLRVNTLKSSVEKLKIWAEERGWKLEQVPWCQEGFFIVLRQAQHDVTEEAFGRDLLHQLGHTYIQEAASMLPASLLDPKPGETILDLCSAPGSKTTQIAAAMQGRGVLIANDIQEKRLWTLKQALYRSGVTNVIVTKKVGQWFGKHMTERFDRVLCDAPCTAQGIVRKDPGALAYSSDQAIQKMATLQFGLLEAAIHAAKVGGRIVYSTCTLTPEENELLVAAVLKKYQGKVEQAAISGQQTALLEAERDSSKVQDYLHRTDRWPLAAGRFAAYRLWPQTYDTEGFFSAVLQKTERTRDPIPLENFSFQEKPVTGNRLRDTLRTVEDLFGTSFFEKGDCLFERGEYLMLATEEVAKFSLPTENYSLGLPFAKMVGEGRLRLEHEIAILRGSEATKNTHELSPEALGQVLQGDDIACPKELKGDVLLRFRDLTIGVGLAKDGVLKNRLPRWFVQQSGNRSGM